MAQFTASASYLVKYDNATKTHEHFKAEPTSFTARARFLSKDHAEAFVATMPKYVKAKVYGDGQVSLRIDFFADDVNKGKNETGMKRLNAFLAAAGELVWETSFINAYTSLEEFQANL